MKVFLTGGTGFVGTYLSKGLVREGHQVAILTRDAKKARPEEAGILYVIGDPTHEGPWMAAVPDHDWIINLAGASIFTRWTKGHKEEIYDSRIKTTRNLVAALARGDRQQVFFSTSAVGVYGPRGEETLTEDSPLDHDFLGELSKDWEEEALKAQALGIRTVITRFGIVLGRDGGALATMVPTFKSFMGGRLGAGSQWFSWIHQQDHFRAFKFIQEHPAIVGPVNLTAPHPVRNRELTKALGRVLHRPTLMNAPAFMVRLLMGEFGEVLLTGQKVLPQRLLNAGFHFLFPAINRALEDLLGEEGKGEKAKKA